MSSFNDEAEKQLSQEIAKILGVNVHSKTAAAQGKGTPAEETIPVSPAIVKTASSMDLKDVLQDESFRRGVADEIENARSRWEPAVMERMKR